MAKPGEDITADALPKNGKYGGSGFFGMNPIGMSATKTLPLPATFPNGARAAVLMTFDCEGTYGNGTGDMALEVENYFRMGDRLASLGLKATFNIVGKMAENQGPDFVKHLHACGSEVASHGYWHEMTHFGEHAYHGHYGFEENFESLKRGAEALAAIIGEPIRGARIPYGHFNEHTYDAVESLNLDWTSNVAIEALKDSALGFGPAPFIPVIGGKTHSFVEIPLDSETYDWSIWVADENNASFVERVRTYAAQRGIEFDRTPSGGAAIWRDRIAQTIENESMFTLLCHPTNLAIKSDQWGDPVDEFMFPVFDELACNQDAGRIWAPTCAELTDLYRSVMVSAESE